MTSRGLFSPLFAAPAVAEAVSDRAWLQAMLDFEAALARAEAAAGVIPAAAADAIAAACDAGRFDPDALGREARSSGNPAVPLVRALTEAVPGEASGWVHWGATSQDVLDSAAMLVARRALEPLVAELDAAAAACAELAHVHRSTPMAARTLLQQALPTTFGLKAAGWLVGLVQARRRLVALRDSGLPAQLGGAAGTLAALGDEGLAVLAGVAERLGLAEPALPWHTSRYPVADLAAALGGAAGALAKVGMDLVLLAQTEVGEVAEAGAGGSSTMPHKRNPVGAILARACARRVQGPVAVLLGAMEQEHERAAGAWHAEWEPLSEALALTAGAAAALRRALDGLEVRAGRMRENLEASGGLLLAEHVMMALAARVGRPEAKRLVEAAAQRAARGRRPLRDELLADHDVAERLSADEIDRALDPARYLGSAEPLVDRALELHRRELGPP